MTFGIQTIHFLHSNALQTRKSVAVVGTNIDTFIRF